MNLSDLPDLPSDGLWRGVVLHWSAGRYRTWFTDYHFCVLGPRDDGSGDGEVIASHPVLNNLRYITRGMPYAAHTRGRNSGRLGVAVMAMYGATMQDFGPYEYTPRQLETMCALAGLVVAKYGKGIPIESQVTTHGEFARLDGYFPTRWEWYRTVDADRIRGKVRYYAAQSGWTP